MVYSKIRSNHENKNKPLESSAGGRVDNSQMEQTWHNIIGNVCTHNFLANYVSHIHIIRY